MPPRRDCTLLAAEIGRDAVELALQRREIAVHAVDIGVDRIAFPPRLEVAADRHRIFGGALQLDRLAVDRVAILVEARRVGAGSTFEPAELRRKPDASRILRRRAFGGAERDQNEAEAPCEHVGS